MSQATVGRPAKAVRQAAGRRVISLLLSAINVSENEVANNRKLCTVIELIGNDYDVDTTALRDPELAAMQAAALEEQAAALKVQEQRRAEALAAGKNLPGRKPKTVPAATPPVK